MDRKIKLADVEQAVAEAYEKFKSEKNGEVDSLVADVNKPDTLAVSVVLADGTVIEKGDTDALFALGDIAQIPVAAQLLQTNSAEELLKKTGACGCQQKPAAHPVAHEALKKLSVSKRLLRAVSAIEPTDDPDGKMDILVENLVSMAGGEPQLNDALYKALSQRAADEKTEDVLANAGFYLYDDANIAINIVNKLSALSLTSTQLATLGATVLADGFNPVTRQEVFDGAISERIVAAMATFGPAKHAHGWLVGSGVPAMASFSGAMLGIIPGVMSIAVGSPRLNCKGFSTNAAHAIRYIANKLQVNAFTSAKVTVEK